MATAIRGVDSISAADALAIIRAASPLDVRPGDTALYVAEIITLARAFNIRSTILLAQAWHETGAFGPTGRWADLNPAGLGITTASDQTPYKILDGTEAAALHVWTMLVALRDWTAAGRIELPPAAASWKSRWTKKYDNDTTPEVANVEDLNIIYGGNNATWATDPTYATQVLAIRTRLFGKVDTVSDSSTQVVFGRVPHPAYHNRPIYKADGVGMDNLGKRTPKGVVWHRMLGTLRGTEGYFLNPSVGALTDYGLGVASIDGAALDGVIYRWNDPYGYQSGWASGPFTAGAYGDGLAFQQKYGTNAINRDQVSIETSGDYGTPLTEPVRDAIAGLTAYYADQYGIPYDVFPIAPQDGFSFIRWHQEFCGPSEKICPGGAIIDETPALIERTRAIMQQYQAGASVDPPDLTIYARPVTYPWLAAEEAALGLDRMINKTRVYYFPQVYEVQNETPRKQATGNNRKIIGPPVKKGVRFHADYVYRSGDVSYILTPHGTRIYARDLLPKIQIAKSGTISVRRTIGGEPVIIPPVTPEAPANE